MTRFTLATLLAFGLVSGNEVTTEYTSKRALRIEVTSEFHVETVDFSMERDGEPVDVGADAGPATDSTRTVVMIDTVLEEKDGVPTLVQREFEEISARATMMMRGEESEIEQECPLAGVTLELSLDGEEVTADVLEGSEPDDDRLLEDHAMTVALDALLPEMEVEPGDSWEISREDLGRALGFDMDPVLFPRPERDEREAGDDERGGRRRGGRGARGGAPGAGRYFSIGDWDVEATLGDETEVYDGQVCYVIAIEAEGSGGVPERGEGGRGRGRGGRAMELASSTLPLEGTFEAQLEGDLYFSVAGRHPVHFEMEGEFIVNMQREMERRGSSMSMSSTQEGLLEYSVEISPIALDEG